MKHSVSCWFGKVGWVYLQFCWRKHVACFLPACQLAGQGSIECVLSFFKASGIDALVYFFRARQLCQTMPWKDTPHWCIGGRVLRIELYWIILKWRFFRLHVSGSFLNPNLEASIGCKTWSDWWLWVHAALWQPLQPVEVIYKATATTTWQVAATLFSQ